MKKGRPGTLLRVIAKPEDREMLAQQVFAETSTLGVRLYSVERRVRSPYSRRRRAICRTAGSCTASPAMPRKRARACVLLQPVRSKTRPISNIEPMGKMLDGSGTVTGTRVQTLH